MENASRGEMQVPSVPPWGADVLPRPPPCHPRAPCWRMRLGAGQRLHLWARDSTGTSTQERASAWASEPAPGAALTPPHGGPTGGAWSLPLPAAPSGKQTK